MSECVCRERSQCSDVSGMWSGTDSMKHALKTLGFGDIYHMKDLLRGHNCTRDHMQTVWAPLARGDFNISDIRERLQCFGGGVDYPVSPFFRELMDIYPTAKVELVMLYYIWKLCVHAQLLSVNVVSCSE